MAKKINLKAKLDRVFSEFIRRRDCIKAGNKGFVRCVSCGKVVPWRQSDAGHYVNRQHMALRYDEKNVHAQCRSCNRFNEGNSIGYTKGLIRMYGNEILEYLEMKQKSTCKFMDLEYEKMIEKYKAEIKQLKTQMGE